MKRILIALFLAASSAFAQTTTLSTTTSTAGAFATQTVRYWYNPSTGVSTYDTLNHEYRLAGVDQWGNVFRCGASFGLTSAGVPAYAVVTQATLSFNISVPSKFTVPADTTTVVYNGSSVKISNLPIANDVVGLTGQGYWQDFGSYIYADNLINPVSTTFSSQSNSPQQTRFLSDLSGAVEAQKDFNLGVMSDYENTDLTEDILTNPSLAVTWREPSVKFANSFGGGSVQVEASGSSTWNTYSSGTIFYSDPSTTYNVQVVNNQSYGGYTRVFEHWVGPQGQIITSPSISVSSTANSDVGYTAVFDSMFSVTVENSFPDGTNGGQIIYNDTTRNSPFTTQILSGNSATIGAFPTQTENGNTYDFENWSDGPNLGISHTITPTSNKTYQAIFVHQYTLSLTTAQYIDAGGSGATYDINGVQENSINLAQGQSATIQANAPSGWAFAGWSNGSYENPTSVTVNSNTSINASFKELQHSMDVSADSDNSQRKFIRVNATGYLFQTYDDGGHSWLEYSTNGGSSWNLANYGEPLDYNFTNGTSPGSKDPSLAYYDRDGYDIVAAVFEEPNSTGHYSIYLDVFYNSNGSYQPFGPQWIDDEPDSTYSADANPNVVLNGPENNSQLEFIVTFEKSTVNGQAGIGCKAGVLLANYSYEVSQLTPAQLVDGTDSYSQDATVYANYSATNPGIYCDIAWEEYYSSSSIQIEGSGIDFSESGGSWVYNGEAPTLISNNSCPVNYAPSIIQMPDGSVQICWIMDLSGGQHQPLSTQVVYWSSDYPTTFNEFGSDPYYVSLNLSNDATDPQRFVWSDYGGSGNDDWWGYISDGQSVVNQNNNGGFGPHVQINNAQSSGDMITSIYRHFNTPYYFKTYMNQLGKTSRSALFTTYSSQTGALTTWRGVAISEGKLHYYYSFGRLNVDGQNIGIASAPDSVAYTTSGRIVKVFESKPFQVADSSRILFDENSGFVDSSAAASVLGKNGFINCKVDLIDNATGEIVSTVKEIKEGSSDPHGYSFVPYLLTTDGIGQKTVRAQIVITTDLDSVKNNLIKGTAIETPTSGSSVQSMTLDHLSLQIIKSYTLLQNYPNPFNPTTNIGYTLPKAEHVTLTVYDVLGQKVETLVNEEQNVGRYQVQFNGSRLASGVYFYRLVAGKHVITKKMLMLK